MKYIKFYNRGRKDTQNTQHSLKIICAFAVLDYRLEFRPLEHNTPCNGIAIIFTMLYNSTNNNITTTTVLRRTAELRGTAC